MLRSPHDLLVLHGLRLKGFVEAEVLADFLDLAVDDVQRCLGLAAEAGQAQFRDGARSGWSLTSEGRKENERLLAEELDQSDRRSDVRSAHGRFLDLNQPMLEVCTRWQVKDQQNQLLRTSADRSGPSPGGGWISALRASKFTPYAGSPRLRNDHLDPAYDNAVIAELSEIHAAVLPICAELGAWFDRFGNYASRFENASTRLLGGDAEWFTKPTIDSYHTVWFELHEDLLATLGIDRVSERATEPSR